MLIKANEATLDLRPEMRGGTGTIEIKNHVTKADLPKNLRLVAEITVVPGASIGFHEHKGETEIFVIKSGCGRILDDNNSYLVNVGDVVLTGDSHSHGVACEGNEPLVMTAVIVLD
ncbi:MAG: cupin domain-containing protein [Clostridia bacterium]|nr:cupin domain-containing protein [Clostridia bacterium]